MRFIFRLRVVYRLLWLLLLAGHSEYLTAQCGVDTRAFEAADPAERYRLTHEMRFDRLDSTAFTHCFEELSAVVARKKDLRASLVLRYYQFRERKKLRLSTPQIADLLAGMTKDAEAGGFVVEKTVARHFAGFEAYNDGQLPQEQMYVEILREFEQLNELGFDQFRDYDIARMLYHLSRFMYELEDFEKALRYLSVAEQFIEPTEDGWQTYILVLNHIQTIYQKQKAYPQAIGYAKKILEFCRHFQAAEAEGIKNCRRWEGIASIDIASMLIEQHRPEEGAPYIDRGYALVKATDPANPVAMQAEYDALQVLISTKLELGALDETGALLRRVQEINTVLDTPSAPYFKHIRFYESYGRFYRMKGEFGRALDYFEHAKVLNDSLQRRNDAWKYRKIQQRFEAEQYLAKLTHIESEKRLQQWLRNAALLILALGLALAYVNYHRLRAKRRQALAELQMARQELEVFAQRHREKSELADSLRLELEKLSARGERSDYLEELSRSTILTDDDWTRFRALFEKVHPGFIAGQKAGYPDLTPAEIRLLALEKLHMSTREMADMLGVNPNTINQTRSRLRRKMGV